MLRVFVEVADEKDAREVSEKLKTTLIPVGDLLRESIRPYWKIRGYFEVCFEARLSQPVKLSFDQLLADLGEGWQLHGSGDERDRWAIWNAGATSTFCLPTARWANLECFVVTTP